MTEKPYLSAFCICGDAGVSTLGRFLRSIIHRTNRPSMVDEIVIGWNGKDESGLKKALVEAGFYADHTNLELGHYAPNLAVVFKVVRFEWPGRFDTARNLTMQHCTGEWIVWGDSDDVIADAGTPEGLAAIEAVERANNAPPPQGARGTVTLKDWLKTLPFEVNCVLAPYDYAVLQDGSVTIRQTCRRVLRRNANWVWRSFSGVHEIPYPASSLGEKSIPTFGLLNRHFPPVASEDRITRNSKVIAAMEQPDIVKYADARHHYDVASVHISNADFASAEKSISEAISQCRNDEDLYRYLLIRSSVVGTAGRLHDGLSSALQATGIFPDRSEAYFAVSELYYMLGNPKACIKYYEIGAACPPTIVMLDLCINRIVRPRANASWAYCDLGDPEKGLQLAAEAIREYPNDELAKRAYNRCADEFMRKKAIDGLIAAGDYYLAKNELFALSSLLATVREATTMRGVMRNMRLFALENRLKQQLVALPSTSTQALSKDVLQRNYPPGYPPFDALEFPRENLLDIKDQPDGGRAVIFRSTSKPRIGLVCYGSGMPWNPSHPEEQGIGGSETNFIFLARELSKRGYPVTLYCHDGGYYGNLHRGVTWLSLAAFDDTEAKHDILLSCRTPWLVRSPNIKAPTYCWHQDNGYANEFSWCKSVEERIKGNLYVSQWARDGLLKELGGGVAAPTDAKLLARQHVIGDGVAEEWVWARKPRDARPERNPKRVIYASDPTRGLETLLNVWPIVMSAVPEAQLHVYSDFTLLRLMLGLGSANETPFARGLADDLERRLRTEPGVSFFGRVGQPVLTEAMFRAGIYAYPGGSMPEGFGVVMAQAAAAGMHVLAPNEGALPEVLDGAMLVDPLRTDADAAKFAQVLIGLLQVTGEEYEKRDRISAGVWERHGIDKVTDRFEAVLRKDGLIS